MTKTVFLTGASSGIGRVTVELFAKNGWQVAATMRSPEQHPDLANLPGVRTYALDVTDEASIATARDAALSDLGRIDVLVNNAGYALMGAFETMNHEQIQRQWDVNYFGLMNVTRAFLPHFRERKAGTIVNISSVVGRIGIPIQSQYDATKHAVEGFTESLMYELEPFGIRVKLVQPGAIKTDFYDRSMEVASTEAIPAYADYVAKATRTIKQMGSKAPGPEVVAKTVLKAASNKGKLRWPTGGNAGLLIWLKNHMPDNMVFSNIRKMVR